MATFWKKRRDELTEQRGARVSQHKIAVALEVTPACVGLWESDKLAPNLRMAADIARVYEISQDRAEKEIVLQTRRIEAAKQHPVGAK